MSAADMAPVPRAKYRRIEKDMRQRVDSGAWAPGMMIPSRKSLTIEYGADLRTIQRAIASLIRDGALTAHGGRGTFVADKGGDGRRAALASSKRTSVAIVVDQAFSPIEVGLKATCRMIGATLMKERPDLRLFNLEQYVDSLDALSAFENDVLGVLDSEPLAGAVMSFSGEDHDQPRLKRILDGGLPIVFIDRYPPDLECDYVGADNKYAAMEGVGYLVSLGHARIGFVAPQQRVTSIAERLAGYRAALQRANIAGGPDVEFRPPLAPCLDPHLLPQEMASVLARVMAMENRPTALFAVNDVIAHYLINAAAEMDVDIPGDLSILGFDDIDRFSPRSPILSTVRQSFESIGERAADLLLWRMKTAGSSDLSSATRRHVLLPTQLVVRESTAPPKESA